MSTLEIFLICFSIIISIMFLAMNAIHNYLNSFKNFVKYVREIQEDTLHARQLIKDARQIAKETNELIYTVKVNARDKAAEEIECEDTIIDFSEDTIVAFRPRDRDEEVKITSEEYIYLRDRIGGVI